MWVESLQNKQYDVEFEVPTMSGSHNDSHMPYICSVQVPLTTKSSVTIGQPIRSREAT